MKTCLALLVGCLLFLNAIAGNGYRSYLLQQVYIQPKLAGKCGNSFVCGPAAYIPHYQIPRGNVFCRMEDKLSRLSKVGIKVGVN